MVLRSVLDEVRALGICALGMGRMVQPFWDIRLYLPFSAEHKIEGLHTSCGLSTAERSGTVAETEQQRVPIKAPRPIRSLWDLREEIDRRWGGFPAFPRLRRLIEEPVWPAIDVFEREGSLVVKADVPGMTAKDIEVNITENAITISGERTEEKEIKEKDYYRSERSYGRFVRQVPIPAGADRDKAQANFKDGVLEVVLPLKEEAKQKKIDVKAT
jgi:HSP20 family protein